MSAMLGAKVRGDVMFGWPPRPWLISRLALIHKLSCGEAAVSPDCLSDGYGKWFLRRPRIQVVDGR